MSVGGYLFGAARSCVRAAHQIRRHRDTALQASATERVREEARILASQLGNSGAALHFWQDNARTLLRQLQNDDLATFLQWRVIRQTMFVEFAPYIARELQHLRESADWDARWREAIHESHVGAPFPYALYPRSSANLIHHAYHLAMLENTTSARLRDVDIIVEFGGGYGGMARLARKLGFTGRYIIFDLPVFGALQRYYLRSLGLQCDNLDWAEPLQEIGTVSSLDALPPIDAQATSLFIATWSLSEVPVALRDTFLPVIRRATHALLAYSEEFGNIDNRDYFAELFRTTGDTLEWEHIPIKHLPRQHYAMGTSRGSMLESDVLS